MTNAEIMAECARLTSTMGSPLPSPCISVCIMDDAQELCTGCLRTIDEIMAWGALSEPAKRAIWQKIEQRAAKALAAERSTDGPST
ncbi:MAG: DUF1289 domain-containing protein [Burkholderiales bacterium]